MNLSEMQIYGLVLCYFSIGLLCSMEHWIEYIPTYNAFFTKVNLEWKHFFGKLFFWPLYILFYMGFILLMIFVFFYYFSMYKINERINK